MFTPQPPKDIKVTMDYKGSQIRASQKAKEDSIRMASAARDATLIVTTFYPELATNPDKEKIIKAKWEEWRDYFHNQLDQPFI